MKEGLSEYSAPQLKTVLFSYRITLAAASHPSSINDMDTASELNDDDFE